MLLIPLEVNNIQFHKNRSAAPNADLFFFCPVLSELVRTCPKASGTVPDLSCWFHCFTLAAGASGAS